MRSLTGHIGTCVKSCRGFKLAGAWVVRYHRHSGGGRTSVCQSELGRRSGFFGPFRALFLITQASPQGATLITMRA